tara:strand:+ start:796 stop:945 length:150 start_codon:yes stop_codon:yes gene_type:complete
VTGPAVSLGRRATEPVPEPWIFLAQVVHSGEAIGDVFVDDAGFEGETTS